MGEAGVPRGDEHRQGGVAGGRCLRKGPATEEGRPSADCPLTSPGTGQGSSLGASPPAVVLTAHLSWLQIYEGAYHILHKELPEVTSSVFREINTWVSQRTAVAGAGCPP